MNSWNTYIHNNTTHVFIRSFVHPFVIASFRDQISNSDLWDNANMFNDAPMSPVTNDKVELRRYRKTDNGADICIQMHTLLQSCTHANNLHLHINMHSYIGTELDSVEVRILQTPQTIKGSVKLIGANNNSMLASVESAIKSRKLF